MPDVNGVNYAKAFVNTPREPVHAVHYRGKIRRVADSYEASSAAAGTDILVGRIQKGAAIVGESRVHHDALGASTTLQIALRGRSSGTVTALHTAESSSSAGDISMHNYVLINGGASVAAEDSDIIIRIAGAAATGTILSEMRVSEN